METKHDYLAALCRIRAICERTTDGLTDTPADDSAMASALRMIRETCDEYAPAPHVSPTALLKSRHGMDLVRFAAKDRVKLVGTRPTGAGAQLWEITIRASVKN